MYYSSWNQNLEKVDMLPEIMFPTILDCCLVWLFLHFTARVSASEKGSGWRWFSESKEFTNWKKTQEGVCVCGGAGAGG